LTERLERQEATVERLVAPSWTRRRFVAASGVAAITGSGARRRTLAQVATPVADFELPEEVSWATFSPLAHDQAVAIGDALRAAAGVRLNIQPSDRDVVGVEALRQGAVDFEATAVDGSIAPQEGVFEYASKDWGPQKVRLVLANTDEPITYEIAIAGDLGVETYADLKGKRVAWYTDFPVVNVNTQAYLAYGGLAWDDVERVDVHGFFDAALKALENGDLDAAFVATDGPAVDAAAAGPRGLFWPAVDPQNAEGLARMRAIAPYFVLYDVTEGVAANPTTSQHGAHYPYPILIALEKTDADLVYNMTKALAELYPRYQGKALGIDGWNIDKQYLLWFVPYHDGAVAYLKELGIWTDVAQAHNDQLVARQEALAAAWEALMAENPEDWESAWAERRRQALQDGGFQVIF
jgi:uncharacterized protein